MLQPENEGLKKVRWKKSFDDKRPKYGEIVLQKQQFRNMPLLFERDGRKSYIPVIFLLVNYIPYLNFLIEKKFVNRTF